MKIVLDLRSAVMTHRSKTSSTDGNYVGEKVLSCDFQFTVKFSICLQPWSESESYLNVFS